MAAIIIEDLWKTYQRGKSKRGDLRQSFSYWWNNLWHGHEKFNALEAVSLTIEEGDIVGIVGPNGAGKSTLLKILSRITYPSKGKIIINGNLSSLLEVGVGFHPELTGRDNIYLNGAIQGMAKKEIERKFESIVDFSGLELFLDTPVKQYSSGMYVRLAFSVSAHMDFDILLLDEILGVGDIEFKKKSIEKLTETVSQGRTIIMVSHQLDVLKSLCTKGVYIKHGKVKYTGSVEEVTEQYILDHDTISESNLRVRKDRMGSGKVKVIAIQTQDERGNMVPVVHSGQKIKFAVTLDSPHQMLKNVDIRLDLYDMMGQQWFVLSNNISNGMIESCPGQVVLECHIPKLPLSEGHYSMNVSLNVNYEKCDFVQNAHEIYVERGGFYLTGRLPHYSRGTLVDYSWGIK